MSLTEISVSAACAGILILNANISVRIIELQLEIKIQHHYSSLYDFGNVVNYNANIPGF